MTDARTLALSVLHKCEALGQYSNLSLDSALRRSSLSDVDKALAAALVYGVLERKITLDYAIDALAATPPEPDVRELLRLGLYQLAFLDRIPDHAAVNETVALAPRRARGFVNALLRAFIRSENRLPLPSRDEDEEAYLSVKYSVCRPLVQAFSAAFGPARTESILSAFLTPPALTLRVNTCRTSVADFAERLRAAGIPAETRATAGCLRLSRSLPPTAIPGFDDGLFFVEDEASQMAVHLLDAHPGMALLDTCACPGSKSFGLAMDMENRGKIVACDLHANKLSLVRSGAERLGLTILQLEQKDARDASPAWIGQFDRVLCDVPCSGFGVLGKKPELRYKDPADAASLPGIQSAILARSADFLKPCGKLLYSTCTLLPRENGDVVRAFLKEHPAFTLLKERTLFPDTDGTDGFYMALLQKEE